MQYLVPFIVILGFSVVLTVGLLSVMQDLLERTAESPVIRDGETLLGQPTEEAVSREWHSAPMPAYASNHRSSGGAR